MPFTQRDLTGQRFGRLIAVSPHHTDQHGSWWWLVRCDCGIEKVLKADKFTSSRRKSCGCERHPGKYNGRSSWRAYTSWISMLHRCYNPKNPGYELWGGRGITVCNRWRTSFDAFLADMGERPPGYSLDRINPDGNYEPSNCQWATYRQQTRNRRKWVFQPQKQRKAQQKPDPRQEILDFFLVHKAQGG